MATIKSASITNLDAGTVVPAGLEGGNVKIAHDFVTTGAADATGTIYSFFAVHSSWTFIDVRLINADIGDTNANLDLGLNARGGAAVDINCFISNQDSSSATDSGWIGDALTGTVLTPQRFWEIAAAGSDGGVWYDVVATSNTAATDSADLILCKMLYSTEAIA